MPDFKFEDMCEGFVVGVDEAGRGPWVGPVVAGAVVFLNRDVAPYLLDHLNDSKKISPKVREALFTLIEENGKGFSKGYNEDIIPELIEQEKYLLDAIKKCMELPQGA